MEPSRNPSTPPTSWGIIPDDINNLSHNSPQQEELYIDPILLRIDGFSHSPAPDYPTGAFTPPNRAASPSPFTSGNGGTARLQPIPQVPPSFPVPCPANFFTPSYSSPESNRRDSSNLAFVTPALLGSPTSTTLGNSLDADSPSLKVPSSSSGQVISNTATPTQVDSKNTFPCTKGCENVTFSSNKDRERHYNAMRCKGYDDTKPKNYQCDCGKGFDRKDSHVRHLKTCQGDSKGFLCHRCNHQADDKETHQAHLKCCTQRRGRHPERVDSPSIM